MYAMKLFYFADVASDGGSLCCEKSFCSSMGVGQGCSQCRQGMEYRKLRIRNFLMAAWLSLALDPSCVERFHISIRRLLLLPQLPCGIMSGQHYLKGHWLYLHQRTFSDCTCELNVLVCTFLRVCVSWKVICQPPTFASWSEMVCI